jgi:hypothetical protein
MKNPEIKKSQRDLVAEFEAERKRLRLSINQACAFFPAVSYRTIYRYATQKSGQRLPLYRNEFRRGMRRLKRLPSPIPDERGELRFLYNELKGQISAKERMELLSDLRLYPFRVRALAKKYAVIPE